MVENRINKLVTRDNSFYLQHFHHFLIAVMGVILILIICVGIVLYQISHRPVPPYYAFQSGTHNKMTLTPFREPNLLPDTILKWASNAATTAYTFDYVNYNAQIGSARSFFTDVGWQDFLRSIAPVVRDIVQKQIFVNGVVSGTPVISNQGPLPGTKYTWRIQIPFLVTYQAGSALSKSRFIVLLTVIRIPTSTNFKAIGIEQFVMVPVGNIA